MTNKDIYKIGFRKIGLKFFFYGSLHVILCRINGYADDLKYIFIKIFKQRNYAKVMINGYLMYIDFKDSGISKELYIHKKREYFSTEFIKKFIHENDIAIDIGANIGYYALLESAIVKKVHAIEPVPSNVETLNKNVQLNNFKNVSVYKCAIGDKKEKTKMYICDKCNWCSFIKNDSANIVDEIDVPMVTLDTFVERYNICPTFIRMDVEGYEYQIILGASKILEKDIPLKLFIELHPHLMNREKFMGLLDILKYRKFKIKAIFLETGPHNYRNITLLNRLRKIIGFPEFGTIGNSYDDIDRLSKYNCSSSVFFERE